MLNNPRSTGIFKIASYEPTFALISIPRRISTSLFPRPVKFPPPKSSSLSLVINFKIKSSRANHSFSVASSFSRPGALRRDPRSRLKYLRHIYVNSTIFDKEASIRYVRKIFGILDLLPLVRTCVRLFVRKIGRFLDPLPPRCGRT